MEVVSREEWKARSEVRHFDVKLPLNHVIILHTVTRFCATKEQCVRTLQAVQTMHLDARGWWDVSYNFLVGGDGRIYEGRGWKKSGAHSVNFNTKSLGIAFIGNYEKYNPTDAMLNATLNFITCGVMKGYLTPTREIHGHKDVACTLSPGKFLYEKIREWDNYKGGRLNLYNCKPLGIPVVEWDELDY